MKKQKFVSITINSLIQSNSKIGSKYGCNNIKGNKLSFNNAKDYIPETIYIRELNQAGGLPTVTKDVQNVLNNSKRFESIKRYE